MSKNFDLVIRSGTIVDGSGAERFESDVAITGGRIAAIGKVAGQGVEEINARGRIVTPGFVDIHTHYDGQVTWDNRLSPSSQHGVTTVVMGNCGVGFAPCQPDHRELLVKLMEGVEDVPEVVMTEGLPWNWETFPDYLQALSQRQTDMDFATQIPHSPLRVYVMGERGANREPPSPADLERMTTLVAEAVSAGAIGVSTSRAINHRSVDGRLAPSVVTEEDELHALAAGLKRAGDGVFQMIFNPTAEPKDEFGIARRLVERSGRPLSFSLMETSFKQGGFEEFLHALGVATAAGLPIRAQVYPRPVGALLGLELSFNPFSLNPSFGALRNLPLAEKVAAMRNPELRARLLSEAPSDPNEFNVMTVRKVASMYLFSDPPVYNPTADQSIGAIAKAQGRTPHEVAYDMLVEDEGRAILYHPGANYMQGNLDSVHKMITHPDTVLGLGDGGAHYGLICDASFPTFTLAHWARDAAANRRQPLERMVAALTRRPAETVGLRDRGVLRVGGKADLNVIDLDRLQLHRPHPLHDLPGGGRRMRQTATGYDATIVSGEITYRDGTATGALPGRLVRASLPELAA